MFQWPISSERLQIPLFRWARARLTLILLWYSIWEVLSCMRARSRASLAWPEFGREEATDEAGWPLTPTGHWLTVGDLCGSIAVIRTAITDQFRLFLINNSPPDPPPQHLPAPPHPGHLRDLSSSLAAWAALSSPVGSKLLHLSLGLSPPPLEPPAGGGGGGGGSGKPGGGSGWPLFRPNSHDMVPG